MDKGIPCTLTPNQIRKVKRGHMLQLSYDQINPNASHEHSLVLHPENAKKIMKAIKSKKGVRLGLTQPELEGSGFWDFVKSLGNMIATPAKALAPILKPIAKELGAPIVSKYTGIPTDVVKQGVDITAQLAGVGVRGGKRKKAKMPSKQYSLLEQETGPTPVKLQPAGGRMPRGGSFRPSGGRMDRGGSFRVAGDYGRR